MNTTIVRAGSGSQLTAWPSAIQCPAFAPSFLCLHFGFRFRFGLRLRPVLPRMRSDSNTVNGGCGIALGTSVASSAAPLTTLTRLGLTNHRFEFPVGLLVHVHHAPISASDIRDSVLTHQFQGLPVLVIFAVAWFGHPVWNWIHWGMFLCPFCTLFLRVLENPSNRPVSISDIPLSPTKLEDVQLAHTCRIEV